MRPHQETALTNAETAILSGAGSHAAAHPAYNLEVV